MGSRAGNHSAGNHGAAAAKLARRFGRRRAAHRRQPDSDGRDPLAADRADGNDERGLATLSQPQTGASVEATAMAEALVIRGLNKRFGGLRAVQDVSFTVQENETVALIGPNGAGKTTSFNLITGFHRPDSGSVTAYGREIVGLKPHDICAHGLARTFQVAKPFDAMTVLANVMTGAFLPDKNAAAPRKEAREAIGSVGLSVQQHGAAMARTTVELGRLA